MGGAGWPCPVEPPTLTCTKAAYHAPKVATVACWWLMQPGQQCASGGGSRLGESCVALCRTTVNQQPQRCQGKMGIDTRTAFKSQEQEVEQPLSSNSQTPTLDHSPLHPVLSVDRNLCEGQVEASTQQENVSSRLAPDVLLPGHMCDKTLLSPSRILLPHVPYGVTSHIWLL